MEKYPVLTVVGCIGAAVSNAFGGWSSALTTLCICMMIDYITGVALAVFWQKSNKGDGSFSSVCGMRGLIKKFMLLVIVYLAYRMDLMIGSSYLKDGVSIAFVVNEAMSIIENAGLMGVPIPDILKKGISVLKDKEE
ncbi:MAG: phage holin family protein [Lachnospiraceae bacterium]|nr:phage holin family protein [Lachnospiraceae bacterium]